MIENLLNRGCTPVLEKVMQFTEARHEVLAGNVSNLETPGYKMKDLAVAEFRKSLGQAVAVRQRRGVDALELPAGKNLRWDAARRLSARAVEVKDQNILFHDGNNRSVEKQMSELGKNALLHNVAAELLRQEYTLLSTAIRGRL